MNLPRRLSTLMLLVAVFLTACGGAATPEASQVDFVLTEGVQTMVAAYFITQTAIAPTDTPTPTPTGTSTPAYTPLGFLNNALTPTLTYTPIWVPVLPSATVTITGTPPTALPSSLASGCNNLAAWGAANIVISGDQLPGVDLDATWSVRNNGSCAWQSNFRLQQTGGPCPEFVGGYPDRAVPAGNKGTISAKIEAPRQNGTATCSYKLSDGSKAFGETLSITVTVKKPVTSEPTATPTTEPTATPTPTSTP